MLCPDSVATCSAPVGGWTAAGNAGPGYPVRTYSACSAFIVFSFTPAVAPL